MKLDLEVLEFYCPEERAHVGRHARLSKLVGQKMGLSRKELETAFRASLLHEFGRLGFSYRLRDDLVRFSDQYDLTDILSRTSMVRRGLVPEWPTPEQVTLAIELQIAQKREALVRQDAHTFYRFVRDCRAMGIAKDGSLPERQRRNLRILYNHDQHTLYNIRRLSKQIPFPLNRVLSVLQVFVELMERKDPTEAGDRDLLLATILAGADQVEITNNHERWSRSRRRPRTPDKGDERRG